MPYKDPEARKAYNRARYLARREEVIARVTEWRAANPERVAEYERRHRETHPESRAESQKRYATSNRSKLTEKNRAWREKNPEKARAITERAQAKRRGNRPPLTPAQRDARNAARRVRRGSPGGSEKDNAYRRANQHAYNAAQAKRRAAKRHATPNWDRELTQFVSEQAFLHARHLSTLFGFPWEVDHTIPLQGSNVAGLHVWNNLQVIPAAANRRKSNKVEVA